jgi:hypothetical protein
MIAMLEDMGTGHGSLPKIVCIPDEFGFAGTSYGQTGPSNRYRRQGGRDEPSQDRHA